MKNAFKTWTQTTDLNIKKLKINNSLWTRDNKKSLSHNYSCCQLYNCQLQKIIVIALNLKELKGVVTKLLIMKFEELYCHLMQAKVPCDFMEMSSIYCPGFDLKGELEKGSTSPENTLMPKRKRRLGWVGRLLGLRMIMAVIHLQKGWKFWIWLGVGKGASELIGWKYGYCMSCRVYVFWVFL